MRLAGKDEDILVADIGGTNSRFAIAGGESGASWLHGVARHRNAGMTNFEAQLSRYTDGLDVALPRKACIAVAGPTDGETATLTNGDWRFERARLTGDFGFSEVMLINDFTALANSVHSLQASQMHRIKAGNPVIGAPLSVIGPGTGLGVACVVAPGPNQVVLPTEGGHVDLPVADEDEWLLRQWLHGCIGSSISAEHALSGAGLQCIDAFLRNNGAERRSAQAITREALQQQASPGRRAVDLFCTLLARFAGNTALSQGARGGVFIGGGILPRLLPILDTCSFRRAFIDKGAMADYCDAIPIDIITDSDAALRGAAVAFRQASRA